MQTHSKTLANCTIEEFTDALIRGNGFGHETLWLKNYFNSQPFAIVEETIGQYEHNICQYVMQDYFEKELGYTLNRECFYDEGGEISVTYENLETDLNEYKKVYKNAFVMYQRGDERICVSINKFSPREVVYRIYAPAEKQSLLLDWIKFARVNNMYRGKKIDADCKFLQLSNVTWDDLILPPKTIQVIRNNVHELFLYSDILKANQISMKRGIILAGPPGTGKTMLTKVLAKEINGTLLYALPSHMDRSYEISRVCDMAKDLSPCILVIEDIDWIAENRDESFNKGAVIQLMNYLDGLQEFSDVVTIATSNNVDKIEDAVKNRPGRFDRIIQILKPDEKCRLKMVKTFTKNFILDGVDFNKFAKATKGLSGAHIKDVCKTAALFAIRNNSINENKIVILQQKHFDDALEEVNNVDYSSYYKAQNKQNKVGFIADYDD